MCIPTPSQVSLFAILDFHRLFELTKGIVAELMDEASRRIAEKAQALSDVELAVLLCLVAEQHCIIEAEKEALNSLEEELQLVRVCDWACQYTIT